MADGTVWPVKANAMNGATGAVHGETIDEDSWTRVDPVFNEGTPVDGRVALQLQVMSDPVARRMSLALHLVWLCVPIMLTILLLKYKADPNEFVLQPDAHIPSVLMAAITFVILLYILTRLLKTWARLRKSRWTVAQRRLVVLRGAAAALLAADAALTAVPNLAVALRPCVYHDGAGSVVRWAQVARQCITYAIAAIKCTEMRCLMLRDPSRLHLHALGLLRHCLPRAAVESITRPLQQRLSGGCSIDPDAESPPPGPRHYFVPMHEGCEPQKQAAEGPGQLPHARAAAVPEGKGDAHAAGDRGASEGREAGGTRDGGGGGRQMGPYGQTVVPVLALPEPLLLWTWHLWLLAAGGMGLKIVHGALRAPLADFAANGSTCHSGGSCDCVRGTLTCKDPVRAQVAPVVAAAGLYVALGALLVADLWRARRRVAARLYMANRHTHALLAITQRFSVAAIVVLALPAATTMLPAQHDGAAPMAPSDALQTPQRCASYVSSVFGSPSTTAILAAIAAVDLALVWPQLATASSRPMHEHLQRFVWVDADLPAAKAARDRAALPRDTSQVPMFSMQRAMNLFFWMNLAYKLSDAPHLSGSIDPAVAAALHHSHRPAMALFGLTRLRVFWEHRSDAKATVAWGRTAIVIAWRGTSTFTNAKMDLNVSRLPVPGVHSTAPSKLSFIGDLLQLCGVLSVLRWAPPPSQPLVHSGFWRTYHSSGVAERLLMHVVSLLEGGEVDREACTVYVCGHSLGGALAVLNSLDIAAGCGLRRGQVVVYTIGCPRVGDRAFASYADAAVPDTWHIVNGRDVVTQWGKLGGLYKASGQRVVLDRSSQLIVRPSFFEYVVHRMAGRSQLAEHLPGSYLKRLARAISRIQLLSTDPRESRRVARLLRPPPTPPLPVPADRHAVKKELQRAAREQEEESRRRWRVRRTAADGGGQPPDGDGAALKWSTLGRSGRGARGSAEAVVFGDVVRTLCAGKPGSHESEHAPQGSQSAPVLRAGAGDDARAASSPSGAAAGAGSEAFQVTGSSTDDARSCDLPIVFINMDAPAASTPRHEASPPGGGPGSAPPEAAADAHAVVTVIHGGMHAADAPAAQTTGGPDSGRGRGGDARSSAACGSAAGVDAGVAVHGGAAATGGASGASEESSVPHAGRAVQSDDVIARGVERLHSALRKFSAVAKEMLSNRR